MNRLPQRMRPLALAIGLVTSLAGCRGPQLVEFPNGPRPREDQKTPLGEYMVQAPDLLKIEVEVPASDTQILKAGDIVFIGVKNALPDNPVNDQFPIRADGTIDMNIYGIVKIAGQTVEQAKATVKAQLKKEVNDPVVSMFVTSNRPIAGEYLVRPDGTIKLGYYGALEVSRLTTPQIEQAIKDMLKKNEGIAEAKVNVEVAAYNTMTYYIIADGGPNGDQVTRLPVTGSETVLDALSQIGGIPGIGSKKNIWISRPLPGDPNGAEILPVDWISITKFGAVATNYQILPGDRIFIKADTLIAADSALGKFMAPIERVANSITLFRITIDSLRGQSGIFGNNNNN